MHILFSQLDVLCLIASRSNPSDWRNLSLVSQLLFQSTLPLIWWRVEGVHNLAALLPNAEVQISDHGKKVVLTYLNDSSNQKLQLGRLAIYAPFIRCLEIYGPESKQGEVVGQELLPAASDLLPNLMSLVGTAPYQISHEQRMLWIPRLLAPSIVDIQFVPRLDSSDHMSTPMALQLLSHISSSVSRLCYLSLRIKEPSDGSLGPNKAQALIAVRDCFLQLSHLQELTSSEVVLTGTVFPAIASLRHLKKLTVDGSWWQVDQDEPTPKIPANPFPALTHFSLRQIHVYGVFRALGFLCFQHVRSLGISFADFIVDTEGHDPWDYQLVEQIATTCPALAEVGIEFAVGWGPGYRCFLNPAADGSCALRSMSKLPLRTVYVNGALLGPKLSPTDDLCFAWPFVTRLCMPLTPVHWTHLYKFCQLPNLEELTLRLDPFEYFEERWEKLLDLNFDTLLASPTGSLSLHTFKGSIRSHQANISPDHFARVLLHCWPNLQRVGLDGQDPQDPEVRLNSGVLCYFNDTDAQVQDLRSIRNRGTGGSA